ncbi:MAG: succinylglutamate desuccinylase/aspartoacylase family protein [Corallococcus sp.]|nr:succinylglutamate desuccinylase/aspartoacylase family protein [Corallococcus sp.]
MKKVKFLCLCMALLMLCTTALLVGCNPNHICNSVCEKCGKCTSDCTQCKDKCTCAPAKERCKVHKDADGNGVCDVCGNTLTPVTYSNWKIMSDIGSLYETTVHKYETALEGPTVVIVGGIHGDEKAGWTAGLRLVDDLKLADGICGTVVLIPQANILADTLDKRYAGQGSSGVYKGVTCSDLNRAFPGNAKGTVTQKIAAAIVKVVEEYSPDYVIDLHESRASYSDGDQYILGNSVIYSNGTTAFFMDEMLLNYNDIYRKPSEEEFVFYTNPKTNSFDWYFSDRYPDSVVFTVETNRDIEGKHGNQSDLEVRVTQQLNILSAMFDMAWQR